MSEDQDERLPAEDPRDEPAPAESDPEDPGQAAAGTSPPDDIADHFRRLIEGKPTEAEPSAEPEPPPLPHRHPTGSPGLTGGWMAESFEPEEAGSSSEEPESIRPEEGDTVSSPLPAATPGRRAGPPAPPRGDMPLPRRVPERDPSATRVGPSAYVPAPPPESYEVPQHRMWSAGGFFGCLLRMAILGLFAFGAVGIGVISFGLYQYYALAATLPPVGDLQSHAAQFETTRLLDRNGNLLYEILDPQAGRRTYVPLSRISPYMVAATIATEDSAFYSNPGFDLFAIARAIWQNIQLGGGGPGASTITQQIARNLLLSPEERSQRTALRKIREIMLAAEISRRYTKDEILELYLNQFNYGNLAYGVEAAAQTYFGSNAESLTLGQAAFLAGLVQAPSVYDVYTNREAALERQRQVLVLMVEASTEQGCIYVSNAQQPLCITPEFAGAASAELAEMEFSSPAVRINYPHWVGHVQAELARRYDPQVIYRSGFTVHTTLDPVLQDQAQAIVQAHVETLTEKQVSNGALVAIRPSTGEILAMVGSADFYDEAIDGQVNMATSPTRQPGSSIKPLVYTAAFEKGWTPATLLWDVESEFPPYKDPKDPEEWYTPRNYDRKFHGPVTVRGALANSYNIPAVKTLEYVGLYDDPDTPQEDGFLAFARRLGITTFDQGDYGISLTLGGGEVALLESTAAFAIYANNGSRVSPVAITRIEDHTGEVIFEYEPPAGEQVIRPEHAFLITSILSDNTARTPAFGPSSALLLPFPAAVKTGTSGDEEPRDNWTLGYTPDLAVGVWVGNADYTPLKDTSGATGAAPIWNQFMQYAIDHLTGGRPTPFSRPGGIIERPICAVSGSEPSEWCPAHRIEFFAQDQPPLPKELDLWRKVWIDGFSQQLASADCPEYAVEKLGLYVPDPWGRRWIEEEEAGQTWAERMGFEEEQVFFIPEETCGPDSPRPLLAITGPLEGSVIGSSPVSIYGRAAATDGFKDWILEYGVGNDPSVWPDIAHEDQPVDPSDKLLDWDVRDLPNGWITLRLTVRSLEGGSASQQVRLIVNLPTPTPTATFTPTPTSTATATPTGTTPPTDTPSPSATITPTP